MKINVKTPLSYYGGKQKLLNLILPRIPVHTTYIEPFVGGGAVFWAKVASPKEVLNDTNAELINFYRVVQGEFAAIEAHVHATVHSRALHREAMLVYAHPGLFSEVRRAWAVWVLSSQSFSGLLNGNWRYEVNSNKIPTAIQRKKERFTESLAARMQHVALECADALTIIKKYDSKNAFFYCDPPYYNADAGHYKGYTLEDFERLLLALAAIKGKFLLSSYPSDVLKSYTEQNHWSTVAADRKVTAMRQKAGYERRKSELLTANYSLGANV